MVARKFAFGRAVAVATVAMFLTTLAPAPTVSAQAVVDVSVKQGEAKFFQNNFKAGAQPTPFIDSGTATATLMVPVYQSGATNLSNIPVYWFFYGSTITEAGCYKIDTLNGAPAGQTVGVTFANITFDSRTLPAGAYNISVHALKKPAGAPDCTGSVTKPCSETTLAQSSGNCVNEPDAAPPIGTTTGAGAAALPDNNALNAYFVKDAYLNLGVDEIRWCPGQSVDGNALTTCLQDMTVDSQTWNVTVQQKRNTFFETVVRNSGSWANLTDYGGPCNCTGDGWKYEANVTVKGPWISQTNLTVTANTTNGSFDGDTIGHLVHSTEWDIGNTTGRYNVTVRLDPTGQLRHPANDVRHDVAQRNADIYYRDYTGNITFTGLGSTPSNGYPYDGPFDIPVAFTFKNIGTANGLAGKDVNYLIYIDNLTNSIFNTTGKFTATDAGASEVVDYTFHATSTALSNYIPPGHHVVHGVIDADEATLELNESNNDITQDIYIQNTILPVFTDSVHPVRLLPHGVGPSEGVTNLTYRPAESFHVFANVSSPDAGLNVTANFSLASNASVYRSYNMSLPTDNGQWVATIDGFDFANFTKLLKPDGSANGTEDWVVNVTARDTSNNSASGPKVTMHLVPWPLFNADPKYIILKPTEYPNRTVIGWAGPDNPNWTIRVEPNMTGFDGHNSAIWQQNYTGNLAYNLTAANGRVFAQNGSYWTNNTPWLPTDACRPAAAGGPDTSPKPIVPDLSAATCDPTLNNTFSTIFIKTQPDADPGVYNYSIMVRDLANHVRAINATVEIKDFAPTLHDWNLSTDHVDPGQNFTINANFTDDDNAIQEVHLNFTRVNPSDGRRVNLTVSVVNETTCGAGINCFIYNQTFVTGRDQIFGLGGTFDTHLEVSDPTGNWGSTDLGNFTVKDEDAPVITMSGVDPPVAQVGENTTFWAHAQDATNVTVKLEVFTSTSSSELLMDPIMLNESPGGNFTTTLNFTNEGVHAYRFTPVDSLNKAGSLAEGTVLIRNNVGPHFDIRSPSVTIDGTRYGSATPRIEIVANDLEGVTASTIDMKVAGLPVDYTLSPAPGNLNGYLVSYDVKSNKAFHHKDVVDVNITAIDNSSEHLQSWLNFSFTVDDVSPIAKLSSIIPSYRDQPADVLNVSLNTKFTLTADDNDGVPTDVDSIRYRILGGGPSSPETVYTGPFHINDAPGVYTGPRLYQIQFWAVDQVGNFNHAFNTTTVYVDDTPPALFQFFPEGRQINATFVDDRVGVNRSVVWYRLNNQPYTPLPLTQQDGAWTLTLPEGVKGDKVAYYLQAWDRLDNTETFGNQTSPYASFDVSNHEPKVKITAPVDGGRIARNIDLTWEASDEDGDALVFTLFYKAPGKTSFTELAKIENSASRRYTIDTTRFADGQYTFRLAASDGGFVKLSESTVTILNRASAVGAVAVTGDGTPGSQMLVTAEITKAEAVVEARLYLGDKLIDSYPMNDDGKNGDKTANDGVYSALVPVSTAGDYRVEIFTQYREDGELKTSTSSDAATFSAKLTPSYLLSEYGALIALIGLLAAVGIGVGVFVVVRRR